jgi:hypothetical protein
MGRKEELIEMEETRWGELHELLDGLTPEEMEMQGMTADGWSVKDLLWHLGCWSAESAHEIERVRLGTYVERDYDTDELNARFLEEGRRNDLATAKAEMVAARNRTLEEWARIEEVTAPAEEWFYESGPEHLDDHLPELRAWVTELGSRRG